MDDLKMQKQTLKKAYKKTKRKHITPWKILAIICAVVMIVSIPLTIYLQKFDNTVAAFVGGTFWNLQNEDPSAQYFTSDFDSAEEMVDYGLVLCQQVEAEGAALLMNNNNALPLASDAKVSTFSTSSANLVYGGTGSGNIDASSADTLRTALEKVGVSVNPTLWDFYTTGAAKDYTRNNSGTVATASATTAEAPWDIYTDDVKNSVTEYGDAAIVTLSRVGGEGADLAYGEVDYLTLDQNEKDMLSNLTEMKKNGQIKKIIVLINSANALQVDFLKNNEYDIDAVPEKKNPAVMTYTYVDPNADDDGQEYQVKKRATSIDEAKRIAKATLRKLNLRKMTGSLSLVGDTSLVAGVVIKLKGFGSFDGGFIIESASHSVSTSGYVTSLSVRRVNNNY